MQNVALSCVSKHWSVSKTRRPEVGKVTIKSISDEAVSDESLKKSNNKKVTVWGFSSARYFEYLSTWIYDISLFIGVPHFNIPFVFLDT